LSAAKPLSPLHHFAADLDREATGHVGEIAHAHRHRQRVLFGRVAGRQALRRRGDGLALQLWSP